MKHVVLLKLSGEALSKVDGIGIDMKKVKDVALEIKELADTGVSLGIVVGAGNMWRGRDALENGMDRVSADQMGMLGTVFNAMALNGAFESIGLKSRVMTSFAVGNFTEPFNRNNAKEALAKGEIIIFGGGTGSPFFSTDTTSALRAAEIGAEYILMAKNGTDGVYDSDPRKNPNAKRYVKLTFDELINNRLQVMDLTAATLCHDNNIDIIVFDMGKKGNIKQIVEHPEIGTLITK